MESLILRRMELSDLEQVLAIENDAFSSPWSHSSFVHELVQNPRALYLVAESDGRVVGYAGMWVIFDEGHITNVAVHSAHRRSGVARKLLAALAEQGAFLGVDRYTLEVRVSNIPAQTLYGSIGFRIAGTRKQYYQDNNEDAWIMWWEAPGPESARSDGEANR